MTENMFAQNTIDAVIYYRGLGLICGHVHEITSDGVSIDTGSVILHSDTPVEVALVLPGEPHTLHRLQALIVGMSRNGVELRFHNLTTSMRHALHKIMQDRRPAGPQETSQHLENQPV